MLPSSFFLYFLPELPDFYQAYRGQSTGCNYLTRLINLHANPTSKHEDSTPPPSARKKRGKRKAQVGRGGEIGWKNPFGGGLRWHPRAIAFRSSWPQCWPQNAKPQKGVKCKRRAGRAGPCTWLSTSFDCNGLERVDGEGEGYKMDLATSLPPPPPPPLPFSFYFYFYNKYMCAFIYFLYWFFFVLFCMCAILRIRRVCNGNQPTDQTRPVPQPPSPFTLNPCLSVCVCTAVSASRPASRSHTLPASCPQLQCPSGREGKRFIYCCYWSPSSAIKNLLKNKRKAGKKRWRKWESMRMAICPFVLLGVAGRCQNLADRRTRFQEIKCKQVLYYLWNWRNKSLGIVCIMFKLYSLKTKWLLFIKSCGQTDKRTMRYDRYSILYRYSFSIFF